MTLKKGLTYDEFNLGDRFVSQARTVTEADVVAFAAISGDYNPLHTDAEFAKLTPFGARIAHGMLVASMGTGFGNQMGVLEGTSLALIEQVIRYKGPVHFGDTVHLELVVNEKKETSKPDRGVILFDALVVNQRDETVVEMQWTLLMKRDPVT